MVLLGSRSSARASEKAVGSEAAENAKTASSDIVKQGDILVSSPIDEK